MMFQLRPHQQRALDVMTNHNKGIVVMPTGAGKTPTMIFDAVREFESCTSKTIVVVCPRILLSTQLSAEFLEFVINAKVFHCHSGEVHWESSTKPDAIYNWIQNTSGHKLIFTTYNSLQRLVDVDVEVNTIYFDEAHNSIQRHFFPAVEHYSQEAERCYFFTATPKYSVTIGKPGMNDVDVYGQIIAKVPAPELVQNGYIIPPKVIAKQLQMVQKGDDIAQRDRDNLLEVLNENPVNKVLICAKATKHIIGLLSETDFAEVVAEQGYSVMHITAKHGGFIDGEKVNREVFFDTLNAWGRDPVKKFIVLHHSILAEGINISALEAVVFMRDMDIVGIGQTVGRTLRLHPDDAAGIRNGTIAAGNLQEYTKSFGLVIVPVFSKATASAAKKIQNVVDIIFEQGDVAVSTIRR
jgi:superfamily II DNA or RNA helicase